MRSILSEAPVPDTWAPAEVRGLREAVRALQGVDVNQLADDGSDDLPSLVAELHLLSDNVRAVATALTAVVDENDLVRALGAVSTSRWLAAQAGLTSSAATATVALSRSLDDYPDTTRAWLAGEVSEASAREITRGVARATRGLTGEVAARERARCEQVLLHVAVTRTPDHVRRAAQALRVQVDPTGAEAAAQAAYDEQYLRLTPDADSVRVEGRLTHEAAAGLATALDRVVDGYYRSGELAREEAEGLTSRQTSRRRITRARLHARALTDLVGTALGEGRLGHHHDVRPHVTYTVHADHLDAGLGGVLRLPGHGDIAVTTASIDRVLCDAEVHPVLTIPDTVPRMSPRGWDGAASPPLPAMLLDAFGNNPPLGEQVVLDGLMDYDTLESWGRRLTGDHGRHVLDLGRSFRTAPPDLRRAIEVRDRHCVFPGCLVDPSRCEAHHVVHWRHGGETSLRNMALLCLSHHHLVHEGGWSLYAMPSAPPGQPGRWVFAPPA